MCEEWISIGCAEAEKIKKWAVERGFTDEANQLRKDLSPLERMVILMREENSADGWNHEYWSEWISLPEWFTTLQEVVVEDWLFYPRDGEPIDPQKLGRKIGRELESQRRFLNRSKAEPDFPAEFLSKHLDWLNGAEDSEVKVEMPDDMASMVDEALGRIEKLNSEVMSLAGRLGANFTSFIKGFEKGIRDVEALELDDDPMEDEAARIMQIFQDDYALIARMRNRKELSEHLRSKLPKHRQKFLEDEDNWRRFQERVRKKCEQIDLRLAARGMPRKLEK